MIRGIKREKTLGMPRCSEDRAGIVDTDIFVTRRMANQQRLLHVGQIVQERLFADVVEKLFRYGEGAARQGDFRGAVLGDVCQIGGKVVRYVSGRCRRTNGRHSSCVRHA